MMIESFVAMERDAVLPLRLLVGGRKVDVHTRVAACTLVGVAPRKTFGIGLEFTRIRDEVREQIQAALAACAAPRLSSR
jgi:Tfp pilus assembly protein PilZ